MWGGGGLRSTGWGQDAVEEKGEIAVPAPKSLQRRLCKRGRSWLIVRSRVGKSKYPGAFFTNIDVLTTTRVICGNL